MPRGLSSERRGCRPVVTARLLPQLPEVRERGGVLPRRGWELLWTCPPWGCMASTVLHAGLRPALSVGPLSSGRQLSRTALLAVSLRGVHLSETSQCRSS